MANVQTQLEKVGKTPVKKKTNSHALSPQKVKNIYCILCRRSYLKHEGHEHMHGMLHHRELETVLGNGSFHECQACKQSSMGLNEYARHISTAEHKAKLKSLMSKNVKPISLSKILSPETMGRILERNKKLKKEEKKAMRKKKKKLKQMAGQKLAKMQEGAVRKNTVASKVVKLENSKQVNRRTLQQMRKTQQEESNNVVVQNKENKVSSHQRESTLQNQSERFACLPGEPSGRTWHHPNVRNQFTRSSHQLRHDGNFSVNSQCSKVQSESSQTDRLVRRSHITQTGVTSKPEQITISQHDYYNKQYECPSDFTSDHLPQNGAIFFDHGQKESTASSERGQEGPRSAQPDSENRSANAAPIRDIDVSAMLWQIRRALGVREPCRADREARRQNGEGGVRAADHGTTLQVGSERKQPAGGSCRNHAEEAALHTPSAAATSVQSSPVNKPKQKTARTTQGMTENSSAVASDSNGPSNSRETESPTSHSQCLGTSSEHNLTVARRVRIAHETGKFQGEKEAELKPTLNTLFSLSGAKSKLSWREKYEEMKRRRQEGGRGRPRFGIKLTNPPSDQRSAADSDLPLSEGFHWESLPDSPSGAHWTGPHPSPPGATRNNSCTEAQSDSQTQEPLEQPGSAQQSCSRQTVEVVSVKVEPNFEDENGDVSSASKRKQEVTHDGLSDKEPFGKKKKTKSNADQDQMDQLLAVSLREEELSHSLQDLDKSLIQARNALQAAYTEVQRLLLLRQQCTAEVNSLRAQRIEILQGMQGGYSGTSNVAEKSSTSSAGAATAPMQPRHSPLPSSCAFPTSSSQQLPSTNPASYISQPHLTPLAMPKIPVKQKICQQPTASCNPDTPQVLVNQPVPLFPSDLLPTLLVTSPHLAAPTTVVSSLKQPKTECSTSTNTNPYPESSARLQEQVTREVSKDFVKTVSLAREETDSDSDEETGGNLCKVPAPEKPDGGNESDDSVELMEPSDLVVIDIDESDNEESVSNAHQEPPQMSVSVEFSSSSTQTFQQNDDDERKDKPTPLPVSPEVVDDEEPSLGEFLNHTGPVHGLQVHEGRLYTCSGDNTARAYGLVNRECQAVFEGHTNKVNCLLVSSLPNKPARLYTGSSDQTIRCFSTKSKKCLEQTSLSDRVLCLHVAWNFLFAGLANGSVTSHDLKTLKQIDVFECHGPRGVSCLGTAQEGARRVLLVGSYDSTISVRDAKSGLLLRSLEGHTKTVLCMKVVNDLVFSGSSDTSVHAHNIHTGELVRIYKGHGHAVTSIVILGKVMVTACLDKLVRVYELQSHDRLQVYGGHSDMVMCMAVHKSVIYTGCYDGSVQAVKLNLMKNYRCWWQNCSLIFGMAEHLVQHLLSDHSNPNLQTVKCRWRGCSTFFSTQQSVRQELPEHMQSHVENDSRVQP
ncbi:zinc finger protein 106 [Micropterus salmoides]|uniref:zinc finger protein 106 n=1 Tax=Micropterus salmoides TaxID=27706 RepID=UPI0018EB51B2|nr:zinc finger protein 106 [Micropterus salmoides]XP_038583000.1 zinc finger protein 106 [Micropterus salmoides]XP_038583001.1 zinc finger protein 106 [Micropterus salmoides]